jgi:hypothetical protein
MAMSIWIVSLKTLTLASEFTNFMESFHCMYHLHTFKTSAKYKQQPKSLHSKRN